MAQEYRVFGPPGCGKTTRLATRDIPKAVAKYGFDKVLVTSFSRAAAREIAGRDLPILPENVGTLHSFCFRALNNPEIAETHIDDWNSLHSNLKISGHKGKSEIDKGMLTTGGAGEDFLNQLNIYRSRMLDKALWKPSVLNFYYKWEQFKRDNNYMDFTDLIENSLIRQIEPPGDPKVMFVDEAQDFTPLQLTLARQWAQSMEWLVLVGDDDQASLPGTMVLTEGKQWVPVENLSEKRHKLSSYDEKHSVLTGISKGYNFNIKKTAYNGLTTTVSADIFSTKTTHNHPWRIRWTEKAKEKWIVYLMKKGTSFRVGWCKLIRADDTNHFSVRCKLEDADAGWILQVHDSSADASIMESYVNTHYGLCMAVWRPMHKSKGYYTKDNIKTLFQMLGDHTDRAEKCLKDFQLDIQFPFYIKDKQNIYGAKTFDVRACNLRSDIMSVPCLLDGPKGFAQKDIMKTAKWYPISVKRELYTGPVYGLNVPPYHMYIADGIITHNCIFGFTGASPEAFLTPPVPDNMKTVLRQSYRIPKAVHERANRLISKVKFREEKEFAPREDTGEVVSYPDTFKMPDKMVSEAEAHIKNGKTVMFLASCSYMLNPVIKSLRSKGLPFHNPYRRKNGQWNPLTLSDKKLSAKGLLLSFLQKNLNDDHWNIPNLVSWGKFIKVSDTGLIRKQGNVGLKALSVAVEAHQRGLHTTKNVLGQILTEEAQKRALARDIEWFVDNLKATRQKAIKYPIEVYKKHGEEVLTEVPKIIVGTIHSVKGGEADITFLFPDISYNAMVEAHKSTESRDAVYRLFYVGMTRAREKLVLLGAVSPQLQVIL